MGASEHRVVALVHDGGDSEIWTIRCGCGWQARSDYADCLAFFEHHENHMVED